MSCAVGIAAAIACAPHAPTAAAPARQDGPTAAPTQPRRPTRTPAATATPSPTPIAAAALRADVWIDPPLPIVNEPVRLGVDLENRDSAPALDVTIDITLPAAFVDATLQADPGETARAGALVRWHIARLEPGAKAAFRVAGQATRATGPARDDRWCVLLLSYGSPVEHCMRFEAVASEGAAAGSMPLPDDADAGPLPTAPAGLGLGDVGSGGTLAGWSIVALGLVILGLWTGATMRARTAAEGDADPDGGPEADAAPAEGEAGLEADAEPDAEADAEPDAEAEGKPATSDAASPPVAPAASPAASPAATPDMMRSPGAAPIANPPPSRPAHPAPHQRKRHGR
ncbi:MAG: hypothetical protein ABI780_05430 [Ardenticatenales bacterium]